MPDCSLAEALDGGKAKFDAVVLPGTDPTRFLIADIRVQNRFLIMDIQIVVIVWLLGQAKYSIGELMNGLLIHQAEGKQVRYK